MNSTLILIIVVLGLLGAIITICSGAGSKEAKGMIFDSDDKARAVYAAALKKKEAGEQAFRDRHR